MKRIAILFLISLQLLAIVACPSASAQTFIGSGNLGSNNVDIAWNKYKIDDLSMQVSIPQGYYVFTRGLNPRETTINVLGMTPQYLESAMINSNLYLLATTDQIEIRIGGDPNSFGSFSGMSEEQLLRFADTYCDRLAKKGFQANNPKCIFTNNYSYIRVQTKQQIRDLTIYHLMYSTVQNNTSIAIDVVAGNEFTLDNNIKLIETDFLERVIFND